MSASTMRITLTSALALACAAGVPLAQQVPDPDFTVAIPSPSWPQGTGPVVVLDEAHANFHTLEGRYQAFGRVLAADGFVVKPGRERFSRGGLAAARVLAIANALHPSQVDGEDWFLPTLPAMEKAEIEAVRDWVSEGGALLLIADHMPCAGAVEALAAEFGVLFANGFAMKPDLQSGRLTFDRASGTLSDHPITRGRAPAEAVTSVATFTGSAFRLSGPGDPLLVLPAGTTLLMPEEAWIFTKRTPRLRADGMLQGAALRFGKGRVAVFGEAAMFTSQLAGPQRTPMGMSEKGAEQNPQLLVNVRRWLAARIDPD